MSKQINWDLELIEFIAQFGRDASGFAKDELRAVELAIESADLDIDRGQNVHESEYDCVAAYIGGCIENNFNR